MFVTKTVFNATIVSIIFVQSLPVFAQEQTQLPDSPVFELHDGDNQELQEMFNADQLIRHSITAQNMREKLKEMSALDKKHKARLLEITKNGLLKTRYDYFRASVMFQHQTGGSQVALELAMVSMKLGCPEAPGMVARAYDRFLFEDLGRGQRFGTQRGPDRKLRPIDDGVVPMSNTIRKFMDIPPLAQENKSTDDDLKNTIRQNPASAY